MLSIILYPIGWLICFVVTGFYFFGDMDDEGRAKLKRKNISPTSVILFKAFLSASSLTLITWWV